MLWVNLIMDTLASLALATEPPNDDLLDREPYSRREYMIKPEMWRNIMCHSIWQILVLSFFLFDGPDIFGIRSSIHVIEDETWDPANAVHYTMFFDIFVFLQVFNEINARKLKASEKNVFAGFFNNTIFIAVIVGTIII